MDRNVRSPPLGPCSAVSPRLSNLRHTPAGSSLPSRSPRHEPSGNYDGPTRWRRKSFKTGSPWFLRVGRIPGVLMGVFLFCFIFCIVLAMGTLFRAAPPAQQQQHVASNVVVPVPQPTGVAGYRIRRQPSSDAAAATGAPSLATSQQQQQQAEADADAVAHPRKQVGEGGEDPLTKQLAKRLEELESRLKRQQLQQQQQDFLLRGTLTTAQPPAPPRPVASESPPQLPLASLPKYFEVGQTVRMMRDLEIGGTVIVKRHARGHVAHKVGGRRYTVRFLSTFGHKPVVVQVPDEAIELAPTLIPAERLRNHDGTEPGVLAANPPTHPPGAAVSNTSSSGTASAATTSPPSASLTSVPPTPPPPTPTPTSTPATQQTALPESTAQLHGAATAAATATEGSPPSAPPSLSANATRNVAAENERDGVTTAPKVQTRRGGGAVGGGGGSRGS
eukprot:Rhum_TRINITY_DN19351_c0_g1::Rhum_TRINITY_DN19351_c0_g1_i1::g.169867::m.169867